MEVNPKMDDATKVILQQMELLKMHDELWRAIAETLVEQRAHYHRHCFEAQCHEAGSAGE